MLHTWGRSGVSSGEWFSDSIINTIVISNWQSVCVGYFRVKRADSQNIQIMNTMIIQSFHHEG